MTGDRAMKLMAYADGELEGAEREEVEAWLASDPEAARFANDLANLGDLVQTGFAASADAKAVAAFDIADAVMAQTRETREQRAAAVVSLAEARARRPATARVVGGAVAAMALAASVFMMARPKDEEAMSRAPVAIAPAVASSSGENGGGPVNGTGLDIHVAESAEHSVSVFYLPNDTTSTTSVVLWIDETGEKK
jgi:anti-sigma factor RsiW